ncbi:hypothetical protein ABIE21_003620 [Conyzicola nivalis]|uniref:DNA polymerase III subunit gamma/tau n=1 Tax=Conyzicola nivalis TaxID=1477021 RepID=A0ABV2QUG1_9MICO
MTVDPPRDDADLESEEALSWDGERDASHVAGPEPVGAKPVRQRKSRAGASTGSATGGRASTGSATDGSATDSPTSSFLLVTYGIVAGVYGLYTVGWITTVLRGGGTMSTILGEVMFQFGEFLAISSAPLWFASAFYLTRGSRPVVRLAWLIAGLVLLIPIPFVLGM